MTIEKFQSGDNTETLNMILIACCCSWMHWMAGDIAGGRLIATRAGSTLDEADAFLDMLFDIAGFIFRARGQEGSRGEGGFWGWGSDCFLFFILFFVAIHALPLM
eukprot:SAG11_NODE_728_length_7495_cov_3.384397_3_plen_105_part_00